MAQDIRVGIRISATGQQEATGALNQVGNAGEQAGRRTSQSTDAANRSMQRLSELGRQGSQALRDLQNGAQNSFRGFSQLNNEAQSTRYYLNQILAASRDTARSLAELQSSGGGGLRSVSEDSRNATIEIGGLAKALRIAAVVAAGKEFIQAADGVKTLSAQVTLATQSTQEYARARAGLSAIAQRQQVGEKELAEFYAQTGRAAREAGVSQEDLLKVTGAVAASARISGSTTAQQAAAVQQLTQSLRAQIVQWEDFGNISDTNGRLFQAALDGMGLSFSEFKSALSDGLITNRQLFDAIINQAQKLESESASLGKTGAGAWRELGNAAQYAAGEIDKVLHATDAVNAVGTKLAEWIRGIGTFAKENLGGIGDQLSAGFSSGFDNLELRLEVVRKKITELQKLGNYQAAIPRLIAEEKSLIQAINTRDNARSTGPQQPTPAAPPNITQLIEAAAAKYGVNPALAKAIAQQESGTRQSDSKGIITNPKGALGMFQLMPKTAAGLGVDPRDLNQNIEGGVKYLAQLGRLYNGDTTKTIAAYNAGPGNLQKYGLGGLMSIPGFKETQEYVKSVGKLLKDSDLAKQVIDADDLKRQFKEQENLFEATQQRNVQAAQAALEKIKAAQGQAVAKQEADNQRREAERERYLTGKTGAAREAQEAANRRAAARDEIQLAGARAEAERQVGAAQRQVIEARLAAVQAERAQADQYGKTDSEKLKLDQQILALQNELGVAATERRTKEVQASADIAKATSDEARAFDALKQARAEALAELQRRQSDAVVIDQLAKELAARGATVDEIKRQIDATRELLTLQAKFPGEAALEAQLKATQAAEQAANRTVDAAQQQAQIYEEIWRQAARNVQNALANMLEGILTGQAKSFDDLISGLGQSLASITANVASTAISGVFKDIAGSLSSGGNLFDSIGTAFGKLSGDQIGSLSTVGISALGNLIPTAGNRYTRNKDNERMLQLLKLGGYIPGAAGTLLGGAGLGAGAGLYLGSALYPDRKANTAVLAAGVGTTLAATAGGVAAGAAAGSVVPVIGTIIGALIAGILSYVTGDVVKSAVTGRYSNRQGQVLAKTSNAGGETKAFVSVIDAITSNLNRAADLLEVRIPQLDYRFETRGEKFQLTQFDTKTGATLYQGNKRRIKETNLNEEVDAFLADVLKSRSVLRQIPDVLVRGAVRNTGKFSELAGQVTRAYRAEEYTGARTGLANQLAEQERVYRTQRSNVVALTSGGPRADRVAQVRLVDEAYRDKFSSSVQAFRGALLDLSGKSRPVTESIKAITDQFKVLRVQNEELARSAKRTGQEYQKVTEAEFAQAQAAAIGKLRQNLVNALREASGESSPLVEGLISLRAQFNQMRDDAQALNVDLADVNAAEKKAVERLISEMTGGAVGQLIANIRAQADALRGGPSALARVQSDIAAQYAALNGTGDLRAQQEAVSKLSNLIAKRYQLELEAVNAQIQAAQQLKQYVEDLKLSNLSTLTPGQRYEQAKGQYGQALLKAQAGDASSLQNLPQLAQQYLQETQSYAPGSLYPQVFAQVQQELNQALNNTGLLSPDQIESKLNSLQSGANTELTGLAERLQKIADAMAASAGQTAASVDASTTQIVNAVSAQSQAVTQALIGAKGSVGAGVKQTADAIEELRKDTVAIAYKQGVRIR